MLAEVGELVFSFVVGYMGALEFLYVVRHLYHWGFHCNPEMRDYKSEAESLRKLQEQLKNAIAEAKEKEAQGLKAMKDGVAYKDGFRIDEDQKKIEELKEKVKIQEKIAERQREIEEELERQRKIEEETKKQLKQAEEELRRMEAEKAKEKQKAEEEKRKAEETKKKAEEEKQRAEAEEKQRKQQAEEEENMRKILEAEKKKEEEQRRKEEEEENERKLIQAEKDREENQRLEEIEAQRKKKEGEEQRRREDEEKENERKLLQAEREREEQQRLHEIEVENKKKEEEQRRLEEEEKENELKLLQAEKDREENQRLQEIEANRKKKEEEQRRREDEEKENERKLLLAEREEEEKQQLHEIEVEKKKKEEEQRRLEEEEEKENELRLLQAEKEIEEKQRLQEIEDEKVVQKLLEAEREREKEEEEKTRKLLEAERQLEIENEKQEQIALERENTEKLLAAEKEAILKQREQEENEENLRNLLKAERELELKKQEMEEEAENLQRLLEAEKEMEERQRKIDEEALLKLKNAQEEMELRQTFDADAEADEETFTKKMVGKAEHSVSPMQTVKTQYGQKVSESLKPKTLIFPGVSEESSSAEPVSSLQSSFSTQQSSEAVMPELHFDEYERQAPDGGEDMPSLQYSDDYLRSLDGIKNKPLVREDGSGRRRAFKKRRSSGSSTSSRESRASREEELKMFTSLEEEEFENIRKGDSEYETIKYASEPNLKVGKQSRRHKRSPAKDTKRDPSEKGSLEKLNEEESNPWGEVKPENYKNTEFWKREKNLSIDEEQEEFDAKQRIQSPTTAAVNIPKMSSFEEATKSQHEEVLSALKRQRSKDTEPIKEPDEESDTKNVSKVADARQSPAGSNSSPASASASISPALKSPEPKKEKSLEADETKARTPSPTTGLRRSPRVDEMREYEEKWKTEDQKARADAGAGAGENPAIEIEYASDEEPMSPEFLMEGISDFYDFNASINPSRSRSRSRSKTPAVNRSVSLPERRTPSPLNYSHIPARSKSRSPSPDPASYKFIHERIIPSLAAEKTPPPDHGLSDFYDFNTKLNQEALPGATNRMPHEVHRTSVDYVLEDLRNDKLGNGGAIAKQIDKLRTTPTTPEYERSISAEMRDIENIKEEMMSGSFKRSTYVGESMDFSDQYESLREEAKSFRRSRSRSRSPEYDVEEMAARVQAKMQLQEQILKDLQKSSVNSEDFEITKNMVDRNRRASDTALIQKPEILFQIQDLIEETDENFNIVECEPEEYHHFRRFSLGQEMPVEQYPEDYTYVSEIEIKSLADFQPWTSGLEELSNVEDILPKLAAEEVEEENPAPDQNLRGEAVEEAYDSGSDDERQTVVEVDDEIDEDIWDYNERPAEESHNEQSECEEADREMDRYAGRNADDWRDVEGAVGGVSDEDSFQIDQIYGEAIKNRKPSGILRDYDCILKEIQISDEDRLEEENILEKSSFSNGNTSGTLEPGLWSPRSRSSRASSRESSRSFIEYEKRDNEMRYLADPTMSAINSTRLRSRYGIVPSTSLPTGFEEDISDVDVNYVPKKEYNWRKNFKLDDDLDGDKKEKHKQFLDARKFSLGGESITLFSQSPEHSADDAEIMRVTRTKEEEQLYEEMEQEPEEIETQSKKKKSKRKSRKGSKGSIGGNDEEKENASRRNSVVTEGDLPKKKSRRESKKAAETHLEAADQEGAPQLDEEIEDSQVKKKSKKRHQKKVKDEIVLPKLEIVIPMPEKKAPPPSVAALRAALSAPPPPPEVKSPAVIIKPKKLWERETPSPISPKQSPTAETKPIPSIRSSESPKPAKILAQIPSSIRSSVSPQSTSVSVAKENPTSDLLRPKTPEPTHSSTIIQPSVTSSIEKSISTTENYSVEEKKKMADKCNENQNPELKTQGISESTPKINQLSETAELKNNTDNVAKSDQNQNPSETNNTELSNSTSPSEPSTVSTQNPSSVSKIDNCSKDLAPVTDTIDIIKDGGLYPLCTVSAAAHTQSKNTPESDILKDGGLYPLF